MVLPQRMACSNERLMLEKASLRGNDIKTTYRSQWYYRITRLIPMRDRHGKNVISAVAIRDDCTEVDDTTIKDSVVQREADIREGFSHWQQHKDNVLKSMVLPHNTIHSNERTTFQKGYLSGRGQ